MVQCLHQRNNYIKMKLRVWRDRKCISLVGANTPLSCAGCQSTPSQGRRYRPEKGNLRKLGRTYRHGTVFAQGNIYIKRKLRVWRDWKCISQVGAKIPLTCADHQATPSQMRRYRVDKGNLRKLGRTYRHGTMFDPKEYLYQKEATGMERPEMYFLYRCKNPTHLCGPSKYPMSNVFPKSVQKSHSPVWTIKPPRLK